MSSGRRGRILKAAGSVFSQHGYRDANLDDVVRLARVGKATLYQEFGSKDRLLLAVATDGIEQLRDRMVAALGTPGAPRELFGRAIRSALGFFDENRGLARILFLETRELRDELTRRWFERYERAKPVAADLFRAFAQPSLLAGRDAGELADVLMYLLAGRVLVWLVVGQPAHLSDDADLLIDIYTRGVFAAAEAAGPHAEGEGGSR